MQPESVVPKPLARDVIARAVANGLLDLGGDLAEDINVQKQIKAKPSKKKLKRIFSQHEGIPMTIAAQQKVKKKVACTQDNKRPFR